MKGDITILGKKHLLDISVNSITQQKMKIIYFFGISNPETKVTCLPLSMILLAFNISLSLNKNIGNIGSEKTYSNFFQNFFFPNASISIKVLCNKCITNQLNKTYLHQNHLAEKQEFRGQRLFFNHQRALARKSFETKFLTSEIASIILNPMSKTIDMIL